MTITHSTAGGRTALRVEVQLMTTMYRGIVKDSTDTEIARTSPYYNRKNARAAGVALMRDCAHAALAKTGGAA